MHTSQTPLAVSCEDACRTVPSPLAGPHKGGGTGRGVAINAARAKLILRADQNTKSNENCFCPRRIENRPHPCCTPSLSLPRKGGGNAVALLFASCSVALAFGPKMCACP